MSWRQVSAEATFGALRRFGQCLADILPVGGGKRVTGELPSPKHLPCTCMTSANPQINVAFSVSRACVVVGVCEHSSMHASRKARSKHITKAANRQPKDIPNHFCRKRSPSCSCFASRGFQGGGGLHAEEEAGAAGVGAGAGAGVGES